MYELYNTVIPVIWLYFIHHFTRTKIHNNEIIIKEEKKWKSITRFTSFHFYLKYKCLKIL